MNEWIIIDTPEMKERFSPKLHTDQVWNAGAWEITNFANEKFSQYNIYRRKSKPEQKEGFGWVKCEERLPQDNRMYLAQVKRTSDILTRTGDCLREYPDHYTQWLDYPNPEPVVSKDEEAFNDWWFGNVKSDPIKCGDADALQIWLAAIAHAKGGKE